MNLVELIERRRNVREFINSNPVTIEFQRKAEPIPDGVGGRKVALSSTSVPPQTVTIVHNTRRYKNGLVNSEAGEIPDTDYLIIGLHTLDVEEDDEFQWLGKNYKVTGIHPFRQESTLCSIMFKGPDNHA